MPARAKQKAFRLREKPWRRCVTDSRRLHHAAVWSYSVAMQVLDGFLQRRPRLSTVILGTAIPTTISPSTKLYDVNPHRAHPARRFTLRLTAILLEGCPSDQHLSSTTCQREHV